MQATNKAVHCDCGHQVQGLSEEHLLAEVQAHALEAHGIEFSREDALLVVLRTALEEPCTERPPTREDS